MDPISTCCLASVVIQMLDNLKKFYKFLGDIKDASTDLSLFLECLEDGQNLTDMLSAVRSGFDISVTPDTGYAASTAIV